MKTISIKPEEVQREWWVVDAEGKTLGRLATQIATILRGKHKPYYTPHVDCGDYVIVINAEKVAVTGNKLDQKMYYRHSGYPGGLKQRTLREQFPTRIPRWKKYLQAVRPFSFTATAIPVLFGALLAPHVHAGLLLLTLLGALALHAGVNVISDYFDYQRGADTWRVLGSSRVLVDQVMAPRPLFRWGMLLFVLGCGLGLYLVYLRGLPVLWIGMIGAALGMFYTAPPVGLKYRALGDVAVFIAFGPLMALGAFYVQAQTLDLRAAYLAVPIGLLTIAILHGNNYRDIQEDLQAGYRTVAVLLGPRGSGIYYLLLVVLAYGWTVWFVLRGWLPVECLLVLVTLPTAYRNIRIALQPARVAFTFLDLLTAQLHLYFGLTLVIGLVLDRWIIGG